MTFTTGDFHDTKVLGEISDFVFAANDNTKILQRLMALEREHVRYRDNQCINLIVAEAPTSPLVRKCLSSSLGYRASGGHIGKTSRCFPGMHFVDQVEAICIELLKKLFACNFSDHRVLGGLAACNVVYSSLIGKGDIVMTLSQSNGGDSSNLVDGPISARGGKVVYIPYNKSDLSIDLENFFDVADRYRPQVVAIGEATTLFHHPIDGISRFISQWGGSLFFDGAHQAGLIASGVYPNPLSAGATVLTGSGGKTFSGPQSGMIMWNDPNLTKNIVYNIFPVFTGSHQINRVFALAVSCLEMSEYGAAYMKAVTKNAKMLAFELDNLGLDVFGRNKGFTDTHQILVNVNKYGSGHEISEKLASANIMVNKMLTPYDKDTADAVPTGIRIGTSEITRYGISMEDLKSIAHLLYDAIHADSEKCIRMVKREIISLKERYNKIYYCHDGGLPHLSD